jgi:hypothetical protein
MLKMSLPGKKRLPLIDFGGIKQGKVEFKGTTWTAESDFRD